MASSSEDIKLVNGIGYNSKAESKLPESSSALASSPSASSLTRVLPSAYGKASYYEGGRIGGQIIKKIQKAMEAKKTFYSFEYFPPKTREGVQNLFDRLDRMAQLEPMFIDCTWGAGGSTAELTLEISATAQQMGSNEVMMHLTCTNMPRNEVALALEKAKRAGIRNILALRGDPPKGAETWEVCEDGFAHAVDLVKFIRKEHGDFFGIAVAGYPEAHIQSASLDEDIRHLKEKIDAGADFVITQLFYDTDLFLNYIKKCRVAGISVPIIPGIMPIQNYNGFTRMTSFCKTHVPQEILSALEPIKHDDSAVKSYGIELAIQMCRKLLANGVPGLHFYTLNLEKSVTLILEGLGFVTSRQSLRMPWQQSLVTRRQGKEEVRPIFWANRPRSYLDRTVHWDDFPNGRFGDSTSPAFGDLSDYHLCSYKTGTKDERRKLWGEQLEKPKDVYEVFAKFVDGEIQRLPWCENQLQLETLPFKNQLKKMNQFGFLTINSQPKVNGASSTDPAVGWGREHGYVYQKAYMEFFCSKSLLERIIKVAEKEFPLITYMAVDCSGQNFLTSLKLEEKQSVLTVTWGVFPNQQISQPTVVDVSSFQIWREEAFALWLTQWRDVYVQHSPAYELIQEIHDTFFLVNVLDNDYVHGDIWAFFEKVMQAGYA